uniref:ribosomal protein S11 n=1 Tax=Bangia atropurpurea TaxID=31347 RepID=UPI001FCD0CD5|nr:ribosomal protein S11 [Bangia atropurpurea]UNJ18833.1 ribosomal protein S11 [Bangia atropurpurea]
MQYKQHIGILFLSFSSNNTHFLLTDHLGQIKAWTTAGRLKTKGIKKNLAISPFEIIYFLKKKTKELGYSSLHVKIKGWSKKKKNIFKILKQSKLRFISVMDITSCPYNGCKIPRKRKL